MKHYVLGFAFNHENQVLLIKKAKPDWQRGKWNGVGGSVESHETPLQAMIRECDEEAGLHLTAWSKIATLTGMDTRKPWIMDVFVSFYNSFDSSHLFVSDEGPVMPHAAPPHNMETTARTLYHMITENPAHQYTMQDFRNGG